MKSRRDELSIFSVVHNGEQLNCVSFIAADEAFTNGLAEEAIIGVLDETLTLAPPHFRRNPAFRNLLHEVIARTAPTLAHFQAAARQHSGRFVYVVDARTEDPQGNVPPEDILGAFEVKDGAIAADSYQMNENHLIVSERGLFQLEAAIHDELLNELAARQRRARS